MPAPHPQAPGTAKPHSLPTGSDDSGGLAPPRTNYDCTRSTPPPSLGLAGPAHPRPKTASVLSSVPAPYRDALRPSSVGPALRPAAGPREPARRRAAAGTGGVDAEGGEVEEVLAGLEAALAAELAVCRRQIADLLRPPGPPPRALAARAGWN